MSEVIKLEGRLDLSAVSGLQGKLVAATERDVVIDLSDASHLGALCVQIMVASARALSAKGNSLRLDNTSDKVLDQLNLMGLTPEHIMEGMQ